jgi:pyridoxine 5-phosphate synthase
MIRRLGVNIDHVATLRQARRSAYPDPVAAATLAEIAGAAQITCHIRGDRRHIQDSDLPRLRDAVQTHLNVELAATEEMLGIALALLAPLPGRPPRHRVTLVAERPGEVTTEGGLDVCRHRDEVAAACARLHAAGIRVSLFIDPEPEQVAASRLPGVDMVEFNTARYAESHGADTMDGRAELLRLQRATAAAIHHNGAGLTPAAGHGLTHHNLPDLVRACPEIVEYNIGHSIISRAVFTGLDRAVRDLLELIRS